MKYFGTRKAAPALVVMLCAAAVFSSCNQDAKPDQATAPSVRLRIVFPEAVAKSAPAESAPAMVPADPAGPAVVPLPGATVYNVRVVISNPQEVEYFMGYVPGEAVTMLMASGVQRTIWVDGWQVLPASPGPGQLAARHFITTTPKDERTVNLLGEPVDLVLTVGLDPATGTVSDSPAYFAVSQSGATVPLPLGPNCPDESKYMMTVSNPDFPMVFPSMPVILFSGGVGQPFSISGLAVGYSYSVTIWHTGTGMVSTNSFVLDSTSRDIDLLFQNFVSPSFQFTPSELSGLTPVEIKSVGFDLTGGCGGLTSPAVGPLDTCVGTVAGNTYTFTVPYSASSCVINVTGQDCAGAPASGTLTAEIDLSKLPACIDFDHDGVATTPWCGPMDCNDHDPQNWNMCATCVDSDGDGVRGTGCNLTRDCNDADPDNWDACGTCLDADTDTWFVGCDRYVSRSGPDCDDSDVDNWVSCAACVDLDIDSWYAGCDAYSTRSGPDCNDGDVDNWVACAACLDLDIDSWYAGCDAYTTRSGPDCDDGDVDNWVSCAACLDLDIDSWYAGCDAYATRSGPDCDDGDVDNWVACAACLDLDIDSWYVGCDAYTTRSGPDCDDGNTTVHPGAPDRCGDFIDNQCPGDPGFGTADENCYCEVPDLADFRVDQGTSGSYYPSIAADGNNNFIIAWMDNRNGDWDIYARRYDPGGAALGPDFRVDQETSDSYYPSIATDGNNNFIITWEDDPIGNADIYARRYDSNGAPLGADFLVDQGTAESSYPSLATDGNNNFIIAWQDSRSGNFEIYARRYDSTGAALGPDFRVDQGTANAHIPSIATDGNNNFIIAWYDFRGGADIYARRYDLNGAPLGADFRVDQGTGDSYYPSLASDGNNNFIIAWVDRRNGNYDIYARRYDSNGAARGPDFRVDQGISFSTYPAIATEGNNNFIITWTDDRNAIWNIYARRYDPAGAALGPDFRVDQGTSDSSLQSIATDGNNNFIIAWEDYRNGNYDIYARRFLGDTDCDGMPDPWENLYACLDPQLYDSAADPDSDGLDNAGEFAAGANPCLADTDVDGLSDSDELFLYGTNPTNFDTDGDGLSDGAEISYGPTSFSCLADNCAATGCTLQTYNGHHYLFCPFKMIPNDGLNFCRSLGGDLISLQDSAEDAWLSSMVSAGTLLGWIQDPAGPEPGGGWHWSHGSQVTFVNWDPGSPDNSWNAEHCSEFSPAWGWNDFPCDWLGYERGVACEDGFNLNPLVTDTDGDGLSDGAEFNLHGTDPNNADTDGDGLSDGGELTVHGTDPNNADTDGDGLSDGPETGHPCMDPTVYNLDDDGDGLDNLAEIAAGTDPCLIDTDGDNVTDTAEIAGGSNPIDPVIAPDYFVPVPETQLTANASDQTVPTLAASGFEYGLAWADNRDGNYEMYFARVSAAGTKVGADTRVTYAPGSAGGPHLIWAGAQYAMFWEDNRLPNLGEYYFRNVSAAGAPIGADSIIVNNSYDGGNVSLAWNGSEYGGAWQQFTTGNRVFFCRISAAGAKIGSDFQVSTAIAAFMPAIVSPGGEYALAYPDARAGQWEIYFSRISSVGAKIGSDLRLTTAGAVGSRPGLVWTGSEYGVAFVSARSGNNEIYFLRAAPDGTKLGGDTRISFNSGNSTGPGLAWSGSEFGAVWMDDRSGTYRTYFAIISAAGDKLGPELQVSSAGVSGRPAVAFLGGGFGIAWSDDRTGNNEIYFRLIGELDYDGDGLYPAGELALTTDPYDWDSDGDGMDDGFEVIDGGLCGLNPLAPDAAGNPDGDAFDNLTEYGNGTDPCVAD